MRKTTIMIAAAILLAGCATPQYEPDHAYASPRNADPYPNCPAGSVVACDVEGGGLVGKRFYNCRCTH